METIFLTHLIVRKKLLKILKFTETEALFLVQKRKRFLNKFFDCTPNYPQIVLKWCKLPTKQISF